MYQVLNKENVAIIYIMKIQLVLFLYASVNFIML